MYIENIISTVILFIPIIIILVFFHELGHYIAAKWSKMRVERFSIGFPPRIWGIKRGDTDYCISALPLGGYVKISGMVDESNDIDGLKEEPKPWEYRSKPLWKRMIVICAGVIFNFILAIIVFAMINFFYGEKVLLLNDTSTIYVPDNSLSAQTGLKTGDIIIGINGEPKMYFQDIIAPDELIRANASLLIKRNEKIIDIPLPTDIITKMTKSNSMFLSPIQFLPPIIGNVFDNKPAQLSGLQSGDEIISINEIPISHWLHFNELLENLNNTVSLTYKRKNIVETIQIPLDDTGLKLGVEYISPTEYFKLEHKSYDIVTSMWLGIKESANFLVFNVSALWKMVTGDILVKDSVGGVVAIASVVKQATDLGGWEAYWEILAKVSIMLAFFNILPIPGLDGGHMVFLIYEGITRKPPEPRIIARIQNISLLILISLFFVVTYYDILRLL